LPSGKSHCSLGSNAPFKILLKPGVSFSFKISTFFAFTFAQADDSFNITSITDDATGKCSPQFTNIFANDDYACAGTSSDGDGIVNIDRDLQTTSSVQNTHFGDLVGSGVFNDGTFGMMYCGALA
jgi:hypothetical protein